jgi:hypothetical protein
MTGWNITFEKMGYSMEAIDQGFELKDGTLREALDIFGTRGFCEANEYPLRAPRSLRRLDSENYHTGETRDLTLHIPAHITPASRRRLARALGCPWR